MRWEFTFHVGHRIKVIAQIVEFISQHFWIRISCIIIAELLESKQFHISTAVRSLLIMSHHCSLFWGTQWSFAVLLCLRNYWCGCSCSNCWWVRYLLATEVQVALQLHLYAKLYIYIAYSYSLPSWSSDVLYSWGRSQVHYLEGKE